MSKIVADNISPRGSDVTIAGVGTFSSSGVTVGVITATSFSGDVTGNVTGNVEIGAGSTSAPSLAPSGDSNTGIFFPAADTIAFAEGGSEAARIDSSGRLLVGTSSGTGNSGTKLVLHDSSTPRLRLTNSTTGETSSDGGEISLDSSNLIIENRENANTLFYTNGAEAMRITSEGRVRINRTSGLYTEQLLVESNTQTVNPMTVSNTDTDNSAEYSILFRRNTSLVGSIQTTLSATNYVTSSDHRLKENVVPLTGAVDRVNQLQVRRFNFIADPDTTVDGFLAHEAQAVVPEAVTGTHNEVEVWKEGEELPDGVSVGDNKLDEGGNTIPVYQGIDQSKLVPLLTAALQEALAKIETLETQNAAILARLDALEGN